MFSSVDPSPRNMMLLCLLVQMEWCSILILSHIHTLICVGFPQRGLLINHHADQSLNSFCQWQSALVGKNGKRHDHAILLTGFDICSWKNEPCDTLGMIWTRASCTPVSAENRLAALLGEWLLGFFIRTQSLNCGVSSLYPLWILSYLTELSVEWGPLYFIPVVFFFIKLCDDPASARSMVV